MIRLVSHPTSMQSEKVAMETAHNGNHIAGGPHCVRIGIGLLLDGFRTIGDGDSLRHFLLLGLGEGLQGTSGCLASREYRW